MSISWLEGLLIPAFLGVGCVASEPDPRAAPVPYFYVLHADPLLRRSLAVTEGEGAGEAAGEGSCQSLEIEACGIPEGSSFLERDANLAWAWDLLSRQGVPLHLEMGGDSARAWSGESSLIEALGESAPGGASAVAESAAESRALLGDLLASGGSLGAHNHGQAEDTPGVWGHYAVETGLSSGDDVADACAAWSGEPVADLDAVQLERFVAEQVTEIDLLFRSAALTDARTLTFTGYLPRHLREKRLSIEDPQALDPLVDTPFPGSFQPLSPGPAYSECLYRVVDHTPFTVYPLHDELALAAGEGPLVLPEIPVLGRMDTHFDSPLDSSLPSVQRQILLLLLNWRYDALTGAPSRPYLISTGNHTFDLYEGRPGEHDPRGREAFSDEGSRFRGDLVELLYWVQELGSVTSWFGVEAPEGVLNPRSLPELMGGLNEINDSALFFDYADHEGPEPRPPDAWSPDRYPYLSLPAERLAHSHLSCESRLGDATVYGFQRCESGWAWGMSKAGGYSCRDSEAPQWVYLLLSDRDTCVQRPLGDQTLLSAAVDENALSEPRSCPEGLDVPRQGLILEAVGGAALSRGLSGCP